MSSQKEFTGTDVAEAIRKACAQLNVSQDHLDITVLSPGSSGIFGLCRKKARISITLKNIPSPAKESAPEKAFIASAHLVEPALEMALEGMEVTKGQKDEIVPEQQVPFSSSVDWDELVETIRQVLSGLLGHLGCEAEIDIGQAQGAVEIKIATSDEEFLIGPEGQTLDAVQYLLRKIVSSKYSEKIGLSIEVGKYKSSRRQELSAMALRLAQEVKDSGKTRTLPPLNPAERRIIYLALQNEEKIRTKSIGDGVLKKIVLYRPTRGKKAVPSKRQGPKRAKKVDQEKE